MSVGYRAVGWNPQKRTYDKVLLGGMALYLGVFLGFGFARHPDATIETLLIRGLGTLGFLMLHVVLCLGPLARLDPRWLPLLYNRRHLGVATFAVGLAHGAFSLVQFHALGDTNPLVSVFTANMRYDSLAHFPFQPLGFLALGILFLMAATSHDFWLANLTAPVWKALHLLVYLAYGLLVLHVGLGILQAETHPAWTGIVAVGLATVLGLHLVAGLREAAGDEDLEPGADGLVDVCGLGELELDRGKVVALAGDRVALFRHAGGVSALSNACQHQNGPLGEGRVVEGRVVCPWHGYEYHPCSGRSPEPFTERVPTFRVVVRGERVLVDPRPLPAGTEVEAARIPATVPTSPEEDAS